MVAVAAVLRPPLGAVAPSSLPPSSPPDPPQALVTLPSAFSKDFGAPPLQPPPGSEAAAPMRSKTDEPR